ncbi:MAG TPA: hypothetical protein VK518_14270 [Puia sp.]|nr:hypothetical protein [Puia sp.]
MKTFISCITLLFLAACTQTGADTARLQSQIDSLQQKLANSYKPGLGEFMSGIQVHHAKLWFAGSAGNWDLSDFETKEIRESLDDIESFCADRPEVKSLPMIKPALDSIDEAIKSKSSSRFKTSFMLLTNTCNSCHRATHHEFNVIQVPLTPPFTNQRFEKQAP